MNNTSEPSEKSNKGNRKTIQINQDFFKIGKKGNTPTTTTRKNKPKNKPIANNTIKQALAKRVQERKQKDLDDIYQRRNIPTTPNSVQSELTKSLSYLSEFVKNKKKKSDPSKRKTTQTMKANRDPIVNVDLPDELISNILPSPMDSLAQTVIAKNQQSVINSKQNNTTTHPVTDTIATGVKYAYSTVAPPYSNLKNSTGGKPTYRTWNHTRKQRGSHMSMNTPSANITTPAHIVSTIPVITQKTSDRENRLAIAKTAAKVNTSPTSTHINENPKASVIPTPTTRIIKKTRTQKYTVGRKVGGRKISVLIKNLKTRKRIKEAKKELKQTGTADIKKYLKSHGLLKVGSVAPNNVLREMYESAMMSGDIHNTNGQVALHNFNTDEE
jgi:hypothetical protein